MEEKKPPNSMRSRNFFLLFVRCASPASTPLPLRGGIQEHKKQTACLPKPSNTVSDIRTCCTSHHLLSTFFVILVQSASSRRFFPHGRVISHPSAIVGKKLLSNPPVLSRCDRLRELPTVFSFVVPVTAAASVMSGVKS